MNDATHSADTIPILETKRLILRAHRADDFDPCAAMWADPAITRDIAGRPSTREESWGRMLRYAGLWSLLGYGYWAIEERATRRFAGELGFADFKREIEPTLIGLPEIGWVVATPMQRRGYAGEALRAALEWSDRALPEAAIVCLIAPTNVASHRLAAANGFHEFAQSIYKKRPTIVLRRERRHAMPVSDAARAASES